LFEVYKIFNKILQTNFNKLTKKHISKISNKQEKVLSHQQILLESTTPVKHFILFLFLSKKGYIIGQCNGNF
jgi:hypothetical protein